MVCAKNYETMSTFVEVMQKKTVASFSGHVVYERAAVVTTITTSDIRTI